MFDPPVEDIAGHVVASASKGCDDSPAPARIALASDLVWRRSVRI